MPLSEYDHVIEAVSANTSNEPFGEWILPRTFRRRPHLFDSHSVNSGLEITAVHSITVSYRISRGSIFWESLNDLLRRPLCGGMLRHIEMQHTSTLMREGPRRQTTLSTAESEQ
jgi:hypothetical protein